MIKTHTDRPENPIERESYYEDFDNMGKTKNMVKPKT